MIVYKGPLPLTRIDGPLGVSSLLPSRLRGEYLLSNSPPTVSSRLGPLPLSPLLLPSPLWIYFQSLQLVPLWLSSESAGTNARCSLGDPRRKPIKNK
uniref:Uncharacterized protein n=1 Tax=Tanacetum cinerariifolium TaxID=118510 RepID=A0A6L2LN06_TANCI|nr:hypothetical protein [Tanacetum cinerariifolium]